MQTTPTHTETDTASQLRTCAKNIETYRIDLDLKKAPLLRQYPDLGSDKTYTKIVNGDLDQLDIENWLEKYQQVWNGIQHDEQGADDGLIESLGAPVNLCRSYLETRKEKGNSRFILVLGDTGVGKSSAVKVLAAKPYGGATVIVEACDAWQGPKGTAGPLLKAIGAALGMLGLPTAKAALLNEVVAKLSSQRRCLVVEEAHHLCPQGLNTLKTLINLTPVIVVATAIPVLWDRMAGSKSAWAEVKQLTGNRLAERIVLLLKVEDIISFLESRDTGLSAADIAKVAPRLREEAVPLGNMKFVKRATACFKLEVERGQEASLDTFTNAIAKEKKRR